jgi:MoaA/NifB/PqqE/SkfB family radical SAM enzyme
MKDFEGKLVTGGSFIEDGKVYFVENGYKRWIISADVFSEKGFKWEDVIQVNAEEVGKIPVGENISSTHCGFTDLKPPLLSEEQSKQYQNKFDLNSIDANNLLNDLEIKEDVEYCNSWPKTLILNLTATCNVLCRFCGQTQFHKTFSQGANLSFIDSEKLKRIFSEIHVGYPTHVDLQGDGEPLIQKDFKEVYEYCRSKFPFSYMRVCTNGVALTPRMSEFLIEGKLAWLNVSLNAGSAAVHERVAGLRVFDKIISNISYLQTLKSKLNTNKPEIGMSYVLARYNLDDVENFIYLCADLGIKNAGIQYMTVVYNEMLHDSVIYEKKRTNEILERTRILAEKLGVHVNLPAPFEHTDDQDLQNSPPILSFDHIGRLKERTVARKKAIEKGIEDSKPVAVLKPEKRMLIEKPAAMRCTYPWDFISLKGNGGAQLCCGAIGLEDGNSLESGFWNIWNGPVRRFLRRTVNSDHVDKICNICPLNKVRDVDSADTHVRPGVQVDETDK